MSDSENKIYTKKWLLVKWNGSNMFDIINISDVVLENRKDLYIGNTVLVKCGKIKSPANILQISNNTDALYVELRKLQKNILSESSHNLTDIENFTPKTKKRRVIKEDKENKHMFQTNEAKETNKDILIDKLLKENKELKAELYESNKLLNAMCKKLNSIVQNVQNKILDQTNDSDNKLLVQNVNKSSPSNSTETISFPIEESNNNILIGSGKTPIHQYVYNQINWSSYKIATRKLLMAVFPREVLATHSLTGKPSPAFSNNSTPTKMRLDPQKVNDIVEIISLKCGVTESMVRSAITTKCADENKMYKKRIYKNE